MWFTYRYHFDKKKTQKDKCGLKSENNTVIPVIIIKPCTSAAKKG